VTTPAFYSFFWSHGEIFILYPDKRTRSREFFSIA
jgi:hypothetical protein